MSLKDTYNIKLDWRDITGFLSKLKERGIALNYSTFVGQGTIRGAALAPYGLLGKGKPHPRSYGTFPRVLGKYIREEKILPLKDMLKKMTSIPAKNFGFISHGVLQVDNFADIVIFDEVKVIDKATWKNPHQYPEGIEYVIVNGGVVIQSGEHTGNLGGKILRCSP